MRSSAGKKAVGSGLLQPSYALKSKCRQLTVGDYIEIVCDDNLQPLVLSGTPPAEALNGAKMAVLQEFAELSGAGQSEAGILHKNIVAKQEDIFAATTALQAFDGYFDEELRARACKVLNACGISTGTWGKEVTEANIRRAAAEIKSKQARLDNDVERYNKLVAKADSKKVTESDLRREMVIVGGDGVVPDDCNLATYAAKVKAHRETIKALEAQKLKIKR